MRNGIDTTPPFWEDIFYISFTESKAEPNFEWNTLSSELE